MLPIQSISAEISVERRPTSRKDAEGIGPGLICSLALHVLVALLIVFGLPRWAPPPQVEAVIPVDLVRLGERTASPSRQEKAALPQEKAPENSKLKPANPVPLAQAPPPTRRAKAPESDPLAALALRANVDLPKPQEGQSLRPLAAAKPPKKPAPPLDDLDTRLKSLAKLRQQQAAVPPSPRQQDGLGSSNVAASSNKAAFGRQATYGVKDFIRAQIERHWYFDRSTPGAADMTISIHLQLTADGRVAGATIVDDGTYDTNAAYRSIAISLRDAVLLSQPLTLPPGRYDDVKDITLDFTPREVLQ
jgi:outer membrane biosynthesis protein TonB